MGEVVDIRAARIAELSAAINESLAAEHRVRVEPGIYPGTSYAEYARMDAINHSVLEHIRKSPAHLREAQIHPPEPTEAMEFGSAFHVAILEPERFAAEYVRGLEGVGKRSNADKDRWAKFEADHHGQTVLKAEEYDDIVGMAGAAWESETAANLLRGDGANEVVIVWRDQETGLLCKARMDRIGSPYGWTFVVDVKSSRDASPASFRKDVANFGYARQLAMYLDGAATLAPAERRNAIIAVEKARPFGVAIYELTDAAIEEGRKQYRRNLRQYATCKAKGSWPGYPDSLIPLSLPPWAYESEEE